MGRPKKQTPQYSTDVINGYTYYRTRIVDADGKRVSLRAKSPEELEAKKAEALRPTLGQRPSRITAPR